MIKKLEKWLIKKYQLFSKNNIGKCRLTPTCSNYALIAINRFGFIKGNFLLLKRLLNCGLNRHVNGVDKVPQNIKGDYKWLI